MKRSEQDQLLNGLIAGEDLANFRQSTIESTLISLRRRRRRRHVAQACLLAGLSILIASFLLSHSDLGKEGGTPVGAVANAPDGIPAHRDEGIKLISDEELFALFPNRPLALVGFPGHQQLVFLDQAAPGIRD